MKIQLNGMQYIKHSSYYLGHMGQYLVVVFVKDTSTGIIKQYANFVDSADDENEIEMIMRRGFKPEHLQAFLNKTLAE